MGEMLITLGHLAADPPPPINFGAVTNLLRAAWTVFLVIAMFGLFTAAKKGHYAAVLVAIALFTVLSMVVYVPQVMQNLGTTLSKYIS
jgi:hypothetical protein